MYGFSRIVRKGDDYKSYYHELFLRGRFDLCKRINRVKSSSGEERSSQKEPDFSQMAPVPAEAGEQHTMERQHYQTPKSPPVNTNYAFDAASYPSRKLTFATGQEQLPSLFVNSEEQGTRKRPALPIDFHYPSSKRSILTKSTANDLQRQDAGWTDIPEHSLDSAKERPGRRESRPLYLLDQAPDETASTEKEQFQQHLVNSSVFAAIQRRTGLPDETTQPPYDQSFTAAAQGVFDNNLHLRSAHQATLEKIGDIFPSVTVASQKQQPPQRSLPASLVSFLASSASSAQTDHSFDVPMSNLIDHGLADPLAHRSFSSMVTANILNSQGLTGGWIMHSSPTKEQQQLQGQESDASQREKDSSISSLGDDNQDNWSYEENCSMADFLDDIDLSSDDEA